MVAFAIVKPFLKLALKILTIILFLATIFAAYGGRVNPEIWALPSMLTLVFPYLAWASLIVGILWLLGRNVIMAIIAGITLFACWGSVLASALPLGFPKNAKEGEKEFTVLSYNIMGGKDNQNPDVSSNRQFEYVLETDADIVCLQEIYNLDTKSIPNLSKMMYDSLTRAYPYILPGKGVNNMLLSKYPAEIVDVTSMDIPKSEIYEVYRIQLPEFPLTLINVHLASYQIDSEQREVVQEMKSVNGVKESISEMRSDDFRSKMGYSFRKRAENAADMRALIDRFTGPLIICGDFNDVPTSWAYREIKGDDLDDAYRQTRFFPTYTYNDHLFYFHIDQMLYRPADRLRALNMDVGSLKASDHYPILATFAYN